MSFATEGEIPVLAGPDFTIYSRRQLPGEDAGDGVGRAEQAGRGDGSKIADAVAEGPRRRLRRAHGDAPGRRRPPAARSRRSAQPRAAGAARRRPLARRASTGPATLFVAFFTIPFLLFNVGADASSASMSASPSGASSARRRWVGLDNYRGGAAPTTGSPSPSSTSLRYALIIVPGVTVLGLALRALRQPALAAVDAGAHHPLHAQRRLGHRDRAGLGLGARHPVRRGQPLSRLCSASAPIPWLTSVRLVAGRRLDRLDLVGHGPRLRPLPGRAPGRAARPLRGGRHRRRRAACASSGT